MDSQNALAAPVQITPAPHSTSTVNETENTTNVSKVHLNTNGTLLLLIGQPRGGKIAWETMRRHIQVRFNASIATIRSCKNGTTAGMSGAAAEMLDQMSDFKWCVEVPPDGDWEFYFDRFRMSCPNAPDWRQNLCYNKQGIHSAFLGGLHRCMQSNPWGKGRDPNVGAGSIVTTLQWFALQKMKENELEKKFSQVIVTRSDLLYLQSPPHPGVMSDREVIYVPSGQEFGGYDHRYWAGNIHAVMKALNWGEEAVCKSQLYTNVNNPEMALSTVMKLNFIRGVSFPRTMFLVRANQDPTSWSQGETHSILQIVDLKLKNPEEYNAAMMHSQFDADKLTTYLQQTQNILAASNMRHEAI
jgi:hypothetical protein